MRILYIAFSITLILLITGCASDSNKDTAEKNSISSESQGAFFSSSESSINNNKDAAARTKIDDNVEHIAQTIMNSEIAGYIGKTEAEVEAKYGPMQNEGEWYNGLLYTKHKNLSGSFGYKNADTEAAIDSIESDSICDTIGFKLSEITPASNIIFNKDELEFVNDESEGNYYYIFKESDIPIQIDSDENGNIEQDPWIFIYLDT